MFVQCLFPQVDLQLEEYFNMFHDPLPGEIDCKIFSPSHSQMQELGSSVVNYLTTSDLNNDHIGVQFLYGSNEPDTYISEFLDSILNSNPDEHSYDGSSNQQNLAFAGQTPMNVVSIKGNGSCSGSDTEGVNSLVS